VSSEAGSPGSSLIVQNDEVTLREVNIPKIHGILEILVQNLTAGHQERISSYLARLYMSTQASLLALSLSETRERKRSRK
jgi:ABC-type transport system involved in cytochrome c biogenesis ATPase subunit